MSVAHQDDTLLDDDLDSDSPMATAKEAGLRQLTLRRQLEDRLERRRLKDELGCDDLLELGY
ncbi:PA3496 family putative envelope integrity protein [Gilvimarinus polysaccharolyticus]|uniref:PA3496 family putative envelope integrity protein n=1 Tax=Gilvimarinus polysaccharolyticus TaxID=863921 RepID=UPI000673852E|nr:hypothetical protein [Gilvimarinus polysaccharolyticus]